MFDLHVGQELEFIAPATVEGETIAKGTRVRVGHILSELPEDKVMLVVLNEGTARTITTDRHIVTLHCMPPLGGA